MQLTKASQELLLRYNRHPQLCRDYWIHFCINNASRWEALCLKCSFCIVFKPSFSCFHTVLKTILYVFYGMFANISHVFAMVTQSYLQNDCKELEELPFHYSWPSLPHNVSTTQHNIIALCLLIPACQLCEGGETHLMMTCHGCHTVYCSTY